MLHGFPQYTESHARDDSGSELAISAASVQLDNDLSLEFDIEVG